MRTRNQSAIVQAAPEAGGDPRRVLEEATREFENWKASLGGPTPQIDDQSDAMLQRLAAGPLGSEYLTTNVLGNTQQSFGLEIEFDHGDRRAIARELCLRGLSIQPFTAGYHMGLRLPHMWVLERDASVSGEMVSPVMRDTHTTWRQIRAVCHVIEKHGGRVTRRTGGHINIGLAGSGLSDDAAAMRRFVRLCMWSEDLLFRIGAGAGRDGNHRGVDRGYAFCRPETLREPAVAPTSVEAFAIGNKSDAINMRHVGASRAKRRRVEFRLNDSSLDPEVLQVRIMVACALMRCAKQISDADVPTTHHPLGTFESRDESGQTLIREFADLVMTRPEERLKFYAIMLRTDWQPKESRRQAFRTKKRRQAAAEAIDRAVEAYVSETDATVSEADRYWLVTVADCGREASMTAPPSETAYQIMSLWMRSPLPESSYRNHWQMERRHRWECVQNARKQSRRGISQRIRSLL